MHMEFKLLVLRERETESGGKDFMFASEFVALQKLGFTAVRDVRPGEAIFVPAAHLYPSRHHFIAQQIVPALSYTPDIFEFVYFARPDSILDGISVNQSRQLMGRALAQTLMEQLRPGGTGDIQNTDCVMPVPETSSTGALAVSQYLGKPLALGHVRNKYIFRTFISPGQAQRLKGVQRKLNAVKEEFGGRNVLIIDDSIVRGTTSTQIVEMALNAGANKVFLASCSPPVRFNHIHGIDLADKKTLIAHNRSNEQIRPIIGCDRLVYLPLDKLVEACAQAGNYRKVTSFEVGVFSGKYVTDVKSNNMASEPVSRTRRHRSLDSRIELPRRQTLMVS